MGLISLTTLNYHQALHTLKSFGVTPKYTSLDEARTIWAWQIHMDLLDKRAGKSPRQNVKLYHLLC